MRIILIPRATRDLPGLRWESATKLQALRGRSLALLGMR